MINAALTHLLESEQTIGVARDKYDPMVIQVIADISVIGLWYRTSVESS